VGQGLGNSSIRRRRPYSEESPTKSGGPAGNHERLRRRKKEVIMTPVGESYLLQEKERGHLRWLGGGGGGLLFITGGSRLPFPRKRDPSSNKPGSANQETMKEKDRWCEKRSRTTTRETDTPARDSAKGSDLNRYSRKRRKGTFDSGGKERKINNNN